MKFNIRNINNNNPSIGFLILSLISTFALAIALEDAIILGYGILILSLFVLAAATDKGTPEKNLQYFMWSNKDMGASIIYGIIGGVITLLLGIIILGISSRDMASIVPDFSFSSKLVAASVVTPNIISFFNILSQWTTVAPAEEALARILGPYSSISLVKNFYLALIFGSLIWISMHIFTFILQNTSPAMYLVLAILSGINIILLYSTKNIFSPIISHGTYNTGVILLSGITLSSIVAILLITILLLTIYVRSKDATKI